MTLPLEREEKILADLRETIREARELLKDFKALKKEYKEFGDNWQEDVKLQINNNVRDGLSTYEKALNKAIEMSTAKVFARFDKLEKILMGENKKHTESIPSLLEKAIDRGLKPGDLK